MVPNDSEYQLEHRVVHENENCREYEIVDEIGGHFGFVRGEYYRESDADGTYEQSFYRHVEEVDRMARHDGGIVFDDGVHIPSSS